MSFRHSLKEEVKENVSEAERPEQWLHFVLAGKASKQKTVRHDIISIILEAGGKVRLGPQGRSPHLSRVWGAGL